MLLLDDKLGMIQATAKKHLIPKIKAEVQEGSAYEVENVLVMQNDPKYATTKHKFKLNLIDRTTFTKLDESSIPMNQYDFMPFKDILVADREGQYIDVIGHVVEKEDIREKEVNGKKSKLIDITLEDSENNRIHCSLWEDYARQMHSFLTSNDSSSPLVVVLQLCKLKKYFGVMVVSNAFNGTKLIVDSEEPNIKEYKSKLDGVDIAVSQGVSQFTWTMTVPLADDMLQSRMMTIEDLIESTDSCMGVVLATVCDIEAEYG